MLNIKLSILNAIRSKKIYLCYDIFRKSAKCLSLVSKIENILLESNLKISFYHVTYRSK